MTLFFYFTTVFGKRLKSHKEFTFYHKVITITVSITFNEHP